MLLFRQIATVCPGVGGEFLFIKALGDIQDALGRHAESGGSGFLQGREAMRQGGGAGFLFPQRFQNRSFLAVDRFQNGGNLSKVHKTPGAVQSVLRVGRHEGDGTFSVGVDDACPQHKIIRGLEMGDLPVAGHNQRQRGRLDSAEGKHFRASVFSACDGQGAGGVYADQPVGHHSGAGGVPQRSIGGVVRDVAEGDADGAVIQGRQPDTEDRAAIAEMFQHFINKKLAFPVGVARMDDGGGVAQQFADGVELCFRRALDHIFP